MKKEIILKKNNILKKGYVVLLCLLPLVACQTTKDSSREAAQAAQVFGKGAQLLTRQFGENTGAMIVRGIQGEGRAAALTAARASGLVGAEASRAEQIFAGIEKNGVLGADAFVIKLLEGYSVTSFFEDPIHQASDFANIGFYSTDKSKSGVNSLTSKMIDKVKEFAKENLSAEAYKGIDKRISDLSSFYVQAMARRRENSSLSLLIKLGEFTDPEIIAMLKADLQQLKNAIRISLKDKSSMMNYGLKNLITGSGKNLKGCFPNSLSTEAMRTLYTWQRKFNDGVSGYLADGTELPALHDYAVYTGMDAIVGLSDEVGIRGLANNRDNGGNLFYTERLNKLCNAPCEVINPAVCSL